MLLNRLIELGFNLSSEWAAHLGGDLYASDEWGNRFLLKSEVWYTVVPATPTQSAGLRSPMTSKAFLVSLSSPEWGHPA